MTGLFTIGYEGADLSDLLTTLRAVGVTTLLNARELPTSRCLTQIRLRGGTAGHKPGRNEIRAS